MSLALRNAEPSGKVRLNGVQAARGAAALLVVFYHGARMSALPQYVGHIPLGNAFAFGHAGVDFFFVLSGFIISFVHHGDLGRPARLGHYVSRRLGRIMPMYWVVLALIIALQLTSPEKARDLTPGHVLASALLVPHGRPPLVGVAWTLEHEMLFYVAFGLAVLWRPLGTILATAGAALALAGPWLPADGLLGYLSCSYHMDFLLGIGVARLVGSRTLAAPVLLTATGALAFLGAGLAENAGWLVWNGYGSQACFGVASAVLLAGLVEAERCGKLRIGRAFVVLGAASYSLYLIHTTAIGLALHTLSLLGVTPLLPGWSMMLVGVGAGVSAGVLLYWRVEQPLTAAIQRFQLRGFARTLPIKAPLSPS